MSSPTFSAEQGKLSIYCIESETGFSFRLGQSDRIEDPETLKAKVSAYISKECFDKLAMLDSTSCHMIDEIYFGSETRPVPLATVEGDPEKPSKISFSASYSTKELVFQCDHKLKNHAQCMPFREQPDRPFNAVVLLQDFELNQMSLRQMKCSQNGALADHLKRASLSLN